MLPFGTVKLLLARGANPNMQKDNGYTPLMSAAMNGHFSIVKLLIESGADVNVQSQVGGTALHAAAVLKQAAVIDLLLKHGADPNSRDKDGYTYKDLLARKMHEFSAIDLIGSLFLTWIIGLTPPIVLRYLIIGKPLSKGWAISVSGLFMIINLAFFIALGSKSKSHAALLFVAMVSYWILHRKPTANQIASSGRRQAVPLTNKPVSHNQKDKTAKFGHPENDKDKKGFPYKAELQRKVFEHLLKETKDKATILQARVQCGDDKDKVRLTYYKLRYNQMLESGEINKFKERILAEKK